MSNLHVSASCLCSGTASMKTSLLSEDVARGHVQPEDSSSGVLAGWQELLRAESRSPFSKHQGIGLFPARSTGQAVTSLNTSTLYLDANTSSPTATRQVNSAAFSFPQRSWTTRAPPVKHLHSSLPCSSLFLTHCSTIPRPRVQVCFWAAVFCYWFCCDSTQSPGHRQDLRGHKLLHWAFISRTHLGTGGWVICRVLERNTVINPRTTPAFSVFYTSFTKAVSDEIVYSPGHCSLLVWT